MPATTTHQMKATTTNKALMKLTTLVDKNDLLHSLAWSIRITFCIVLRLIRKQSSGFSIIHTHTHTHTFQLIFNRVSSQNVNTEFIELNYYSHFLCSLCFVYLKKIAMCVSLSQQNHLLQFFFCEFRPMNFCHWLLDNFSACWFFSCWHFHKLTTHAHEISKCSIILRIQIN